MKGVLNTVIHYPYEFKKMLFFTFCKEKPIANLFPWHSCPRLLESVNWVGLKTCDNGLQGREILEDT